MKTKSIVALLLSLLLIMSVFAACKKSDSTTSTSDEVTTTDSTSESTESVLTSNQPTTITTEAPTTEPTTVTETSSVPATTVAPTEKENNKVEVNNNNQSNSNNNSGTNNNTNNNNNSNSNSKPKPKPTEPKPVETKPQVITDDTPLTYEMANNAQVFQRLCDISNAYFCTLGMTYDPTMTPDNSGWYYGHQMGNNWGSTFSFNVRSQRNIEGIKEQVDNILIDYYGGTYDIISYNTVYEIDTKGNYNIIFCYK